MVDPVVMLGIPNPAKPKLDLQMPERRYHALPWVSSSRLRKLKNKSLHAYKHAEDHDEDEDTPYKKVGRALHCRLLRPDDYDAEWHFYDGRMHPNDTEFQEFLLDRGLLDRSNPTGTVLPAKMQAFIDGYADGLMQDPEFAYLFSSGSSEASLFWVDPESGLPCKARCDRLNLDKGRILDLKGMDDLTIPKIQNKMRTELLPYQAVHYLDGLSMYLQGKPIDWDKEAPTMLQFWFVFTQSKPPADEAVIRDIHLDSLREAGKSRRKMLRILSQAYRTDTWPKLKARPATSYVHPRDLRYEPQQ